MHIDRPLSHRNPRPNRIGNQRRPREHLAMIIEQRTQKTKLGNRQADRFSIDGRAVFIKIDRDRPKREG